MIQKITEKDFLNRFREIRPDNFSPDGLRALFEYIEESEEDKGEQLEFDVIALCCQYSEWENMEKITEQYPDITTLEELEEKTIVIQSHTSIIIQDF